MKSIILFCILIFGSSTVFAQEKTTEEINTRIDQWHAAASKADLEKYFSFFDSDAVFVGTDALEVWDVNSFYTYAKPYFKKGKAWELRPISRNIYFSKDKKTAWFNEVLDTDHMGLCRGSGTLIWNETEWKLQHYVLSILIPNEHVSEVLQQKKTTEKTIKKKHYAN